MFKHRPLEGPMKVRKNFNITLDYDLLPVVARAMVDLHLPPGRESEAVKTMIRTAAAFFPESGMIASGYARAYNEIRYYLYKEFEAAIAPIGDHLKKKIQEAFHSMSAPKDESLGEREEGSDHGS